MTVPRVNDLYFLRTRSESEAYESCRTLYRHAFLSSFVPCCSWLSLGLETCPEEWWDVRMMQLAPDVDLTGENLDGKSTLLVIIRLNVLLHTVLDVPTATCLTATHVSLHSPS